MRIGRPPNPSTDETDAERLALAWIGRHGGALTLVQTAKALGIQKEQVRRYQVRALAKIKAVLENEYRGVKA